MFRSKTPTLTSGIAFLLIAGLTLVALPTAYARSNFRRKPQVKNQLSGSPLSFNLHDNAMGEQSQGEENRADPCLRDPPGNAFGRDKRCPELGSSGGVARGDFNGDGFGDLAVGAPFEDLPVGGTEQVDAGAVTVIYGSATGLTDLGGVPDDQFWTQASPSVPDTPESGDNFGATLASGDFNRDGFSDLAIGVPGEVTPGNPGTGAVNVIFGSFLGLNSVTNLTDPLIIFNLFRDSRIPSAPSSRFGDSLIWGDFNGDTFGDLVVGLDANLPQINVFSSLVIIRGSSSGLVLSGNFQQVNFNSRDITLAAGDFNNDDRDDLAVGTPNVFSASGGVSVFTSTATGLVSGPFFGQDVAGIQDTAEALDQFGKSLAAGDFNGDGFADLAIGVPGEDVVDSGGTNRIDAGAINVVYGSSNGLTATGSQFFSQANSGIPGEAETGDAFGSALADGDFNGDGFADLAIGVPGENIGSIADAGAVNIIYGAQFNLLTTAGPGSQFWSQNSSGIDGGAEAGDQFGSALTAWNFGNGAQADLVVGVPFEDILRSDGVNAIDAGAVNAIYGSANGLASANNQLWFQGKDNILLGVAETGDQFGRSVY